MMEINCSRRKFNVTSEDRIIDNGYSYILITQTYYSNYSHIHPTVSKTVFNKLLKSGQIVKSDSKYISNYFHTEMDMYEFVD